MNEVLLILVHAVHLLCVNVAAAGPIVCIGLDWGEARGSELAGRAGRFLVWGSLWALALGVGFGVLFGWLLWDEAYRDVLRLFPSKIFFGVWELVFSASLVAACGISMSWSARNRNSDAPPRPHVAARIVRSIVFVLAATNLLYHFPVLFGVIANVSAGYSQAADVVDAAAFRGLMVQHAVLAKTVHFGVASVAVTGMVLAAWALWQARGKDSAADVLNAGAWGARIALGATIVQLPVGLWVVASLPRSVRLEVLGGDIVAAVLLGLSVLGSFALLQQLAAAAFGEANRRTLGASIGLMALVVVMMTAVLERT